jgi:hypothetical protein
VFGCTSCQLAVLCYSSNCTSVKFAHRILQEVTEQYVYTANSGFALRYHPSCHLWSGKESLATLHRLNDLDIYTIV